MQSPSRLAGWGLVTGLVLALSSCGGGGGGGGGGGSGQGGNSTPTPTRTPTPLHTVPSRNERTEASAAGAITLRLSDIVIGGGGTSQFSVFLTDARGLPALCQGAQPTQEKPCTIQVETDPGLSIQPGGGLTLLSPNLAIGTAGSDGSVSGAVTALLGGTFTVTARATDAPFDGLAASLSIVVNAPRVTATSTGVVGPTPTPTALPCSDVQTIIVQTDTFSISSQVGGTAKITAAVFNSDNRGVAGVNVLFDVQPRIAFFDHLTGLTDATGTASATLNVPSNTGFVGPLTVSSSACTKQGTVTVNVVSGVSTKPVATVVLQADPPTLGDLTGGDVNLTAAVFDSDNAAIDGIDVLFITTIGKVSPLVDRSKVSGAQHGIAKSVLQIPIGAIDQDYKITALAGGVSGSATVSVVPGRGGGNTGPAGVPPGEPASITLGASPIRIQVAGTGGTELATVIGRVFDNNGNPLANRAVHYHVVAAQSAPGAVILPVTTPVPTSSPSPVPTTACPPDDPVSISDNAGFAVIQVHSGSQPGPVTVAACADTIISGLPSPLTEQQALVTVTSGPVSRISISINQRSVNNDDGTLLTTLTAEVTDAQGNFVEDGTPVFFEIVRPQVCSGGSEDGQPCSSSETCGDGTCVVDENDPSRNVTLAGEASTNTDPPCDTSQFVPQTGIPIVPQPGSAVTCIKYPVNQQASEVQVRVTVANVVNNVGGQAVTLPGRLGDLEASVHPPTVQVSNLADSLAVVRATAFDPEFDGEENVRVRFTTDVGKIDRSVLTDVNGEANAVLTIPAGTASGTATVRVIAGGIPIPNPIAVPIVNTGGGTPTPGGSTQPAAIAFIDAEPAQIGVRGSGLPEQSVLTFKVTDGAGDAVSGVQISFSLAKIADESIAPLQAVTDKDGQAQVTLTSGERALSVQVTAQVTTPTVMLITRSTAVNIVGGPPSQPNFSLAHQFHNISGRVTLGLTDEITAFVADRFGNPVPPGTAINFTTKSGAVGDATTTNALGQAGATLVSQAPFTANGNVTTLATTVGERPFVDMNGNGVCDDGIDQLLPVPEPFYDANCNRVYDAGEDFVDVNGNGHFDPDQLPDPSGNPTCHDRIVVSDSICTTFSGPTSAFLIPSGTGPVEAGGGRDYTVIVSDNPDPIGNPGVGNPIVGGSTIGVTISGSRARLLGLSNFTLPDSQTNDLIVDGLNRFSFSVVDNAPTSALPEVDAVIVTITSQGLPAGGNGSVTVQSFIEFLAAPTPTPTQTPVPPTGTPLPTSTPTPLPPAIAPIQAILSAGSGAPPSACNGASQTFVVTGGSPPFTVAGGGGCLSVTSVPASGGSFLYTAGNLLGDYTITVTDALGRSAAAGVTVQGPPTPTATPSLPATNTPPPTATGVPTPPAAFIKLDLVVDQRSDNGDGSFTSVIGALVTDASGVVVGDNVEVDFSLVNPVAGVSVTSPGFTNQAQPCNIAFTVVPEPGDALSCIKYVQSLQGTAVRIRARVTIPGAPGFIEDVRDIVLPDNRPTVTPTVTQTPSVTPTPSATATSTGTVTPPPPPTPTVTSPPGSIQFIGAVPAAIGVRGSGQPEQSVLTFLVSSTLGAPVPGVGVDFTVIGTGSETLNPTHGTTDQNGMVTTTVTSGIQATTVRVIATLSSNAAILAQSTAVSILGAPPAFNHFSIAPALRNVAGRVSFGIQDQISAFVNDRFGNAVPPGTAVTFQTNAASVVSPTTTDASGVATATLLTEGVVPPTGIVTVLAYTHGEESFLDNNGNGIFDAGDTVLTDDLPEPFIDFRPLPPGDAGCSQPPPLCNDAFDPATPFERFVDANGNGMWDKQGQTNVWNNNILVFDTTTVTFSGPLAAPTIATCSPMPCNGFNVPNAGSIAFTFNVHDDLLNPLVGGSTITVTASAGTVSGGTITVPDGESFNRLIPGLTQFTVVVTDPNPDPMSMPQPSTITLMVASPNGDGTFIMASGVFN